MARLASAARDSSLSQTNKGTTRRSRARPKARRSPKRGRRRPGAPPARAGRAPRSRAATRRRAGAAVKTAARRRCRAAAAVARSRAPDRELDGVRRPRSGRVERRRELPRRLRGRASKVAARSRLSQRRQPRRRPVPRRRFASRTTRAARFDQARRRGRGVDGDAVDDDAARDALDFQRRAPRPPGAACPAQRRAGRAGLDRGAVALPAADARVGARDRASHKAAQRHGPTPAPRPFVSRRRRASHDVAITKPPSPTSSSNSVSMCRRRPAAGAGRAAALRRESTGTPGGPLPVKRLAVGGRWFYEARGGRSSTASTVATKRARRSMAPVPRAAAALELVGVGDSELERTNHA